MKKIFGLFVGVAALSAVLALGSPMLVFTETVYADEVNMNDFVMDENGVLTKYKGNSEKVVVPEGVTSIGDYAFYGCSGLTSIELPEGVTSIGASAFFHCFRLTSIELPERITNIGNSAFYGCSGLTSIELPEGVISIGDGAFSKCSGLTSINISPENGVYTSYDGCLYNKDLTTLIVCPSGESRVKLPEGVTSIGDSAFADCSGLTSIELPEGVTSIGDSAFADCSGLTSIELPERITSIGDGAFYGCSGLTSIELPEGVTSIGDYAFCGCSGLTSIELSEGVTSIGNHAFANCSGLTSIELPEGITSIGKYAFEYCSGLTSIELLEGITSIGSRAFWECDNLTIYGVENSYVHTYALENNIPFKPVSDLDSSEYVVDIVSDSTISDSNFEVILNENKTKDVVIKTNNDVTFTFAKGTMQVIEGKNSYDFGTVINKIYNSDLPFYATKDNFVLQITYNYSGVLPAEASVRFLAGTEYAGKTLYYSLLKEDNTFAEVQKVVVDDEGYVTVKQNHCSSYLLTSEEPKTQENTAENNKPTDNTTNSSESTGNSESANNSETTSGSESKENSASKGDSPKTGDNAKILFYLVICIAAAGIICVAKKCKYQNSSK